MVSSLLFLDVASFLISPVLRLRPKSAPGSTAVFHTLASPLLRKLQGSEWSAPAHTRLGSTMHCIPGFTEFSDCCAPLWLPTSLQAARHTNGTQLAARLPQLPLNRRDVIRLG